MGDFLGVLNVPGECVDGRITKRFRVQNVQNVRSRCHGRGVFMGGLPNVLNVQNVRSKFFEKKCVLRIDVRKIRRYISGGEE